MRRIFTALLLPAVLLLAAPGPVGAQWPRHRRAWMEHSLAGSYVNVTNGGACSIYPEGSGYLFVNESGSQARFEFVAPNRLQQTFGQWDPSVVATVTTDRFGRRMIRFDSPNAPPGFWVREW
jgi:hypothetical protein